MVIIFIVSIDWLIVREFARLRVVVVIFVRVLIK